MSKILQLSRKVRNIDQVDLFINRSVLYLLQHTIQFHEGLYYAVWDTTSLLTQN